MERNGHDSTIGQQQIPHTFCPTCYRPIPPSFLDSDTNGNGNGYGYGEQTADGQAAFKMLYEQYQNNLPSTSPLVVPPGGPLATAAFESGMSAVEELRLLIAQVQDVARVCMVCIQ